MDFLLDTNPNIPRADHSPITNDELKRAILRVPGHVCRMACQRNHETIAAFRSNTETILRLIDITEDEEEAETEPLQIEGAQ